MSPSDVYVVVAVAVDTGAAVVGVGVGADVVTSSNKGSFSTTMGGISTGLAVLVLVVLELLVVMMDPLLVGLPVAITTPGGKLSIIEVGYIV